MTSATARRARLWRIAVWLVLGVAVAVTVLAAVVVIGAFRNDATIAASGGLANAEVLSIGWDRTIVRFETAGGVVHVSQDGVLYPAGLHEGQVIAVEYDVENPNLVRVADRTATLSLLPASTTVLFTWLVAGPLLWWLRRRRRAA